MERNNGVITKTMENGFIKRWFLQEISITGKNRMLTPDSKVKMFNSSILLDSEMNDIGAGREREQTVEIGLSDLLSKVGMTWEEFADLVWAETIEEQLILVPNTPDTSGE